MIDEALLRQSLQSLRDEPDRLIELVIAQAALIEELRAEIERLKRDRDDLQRRAQLLEERLEQLEHDAHRSAAPFRVPDKKRKSDPKKPGRKKGHPGTFRARPDHIDQEIEVPLEVCPHCAGPVSGAVPCEQFIEEIPPVRPFVTRLVTYEGQCPHCGEVRSTHPLQVSTATGAAATQLGPRALGVALELNRRHGLTARKTCAVLKSLCGLKLSPGGLVQAAHRMAQRLEPQHAQIEQSVRGADHIHADETSWWVGGPGWWLWVFANQDHTLYRVRPSRARQVVHETLGADFPGVLVSDCLNIYDDATPVQHKCYAHHLKAISQAIERHPQAGAGLLLEIKKLLHLAMTLKSLWPDLSDEHKHAARQTLTQQASSLLRAPPAHPEEAAIQKRLIKQEDHLFTFLDYDPVQATNNLAERDLRPAVIARKLSCGNRTARGAHTWEVLASLAASAVKSGHAFIDLVAKAASLRSSAAR